MIPTRNSEKVQDKRAKLEKSATWNEYNMEECNIK